eukprot:TRINITY_DN12044_c0_g1_i3.p1 TRINITY_DN12044_c0_g1~~TRINITY_DN12044_c0_g1_i3.p1  ORF type:complete len:729 (+),score=240.91 TRINITY_DN12044_c0_g1_i3:631-2817(+)
MSHLNPAVVFSVIKLVVRYLDYVQDEETVRALYKRIAPSLGSLLSGPPEISFIILRNLQVIMLKRPGFFEKETKVFFCNFNDPYYLKLEKLDILINLCDAKNFDVVVNELFVYSTQFDPEFVRKAIKGIGKISMKIDKAVDKCITVCVNILNDAKENNRAPHAIQEVVVCVANILRKYPQKFDAEQCLNEVMKAHELITEPEAKASFIWLLGEYAENIKRISALFQPFIDSFLSEQSVVQQQILTAAVKIFLKLPDFTEDTITRVLESATESIENPDIRDRAFIYWKMLSIDPDRAKKIVLAERPPYKYEEAAVDQSHVDKLIQNLGNVTAVFHKTPEDVYKTQVLYDQREKEEEEEESPKQPQAAQAQNQPNQAKEVPAERKAEAQNVDLLDFDFESKPKQPSAPAPTQAPAPTPAPAGQNKNLKLNKPGEKKEEQKTGGGSNFVNLLDDFVTPAPAPTQSVNKGGDLLDFDSPAPTPALTHQSSAVPYEKVLDENTSGFNNGAAGLVVQASFLRENQKILLGLKIRNASGGTIELLDLQIKANFFGLKAEKIAPRQLAPGAQTEVKVGLNVTGGANPTPISTPLFFQVGLKTSLDLFVFSVPCMFHVLLGANGELSKDEFKVQWKSVSGENELSAEVPSVRGGLEDLESLKQHFRTNNIFFIASKVNEAKQRISYFSARGLGEALFLIEVSLPSLKNPRGASISCKSPQKILVPLVLQAVSFLMNV